MRHERWRTLLAVLVRPGRCSLPKAFPGRGEELAATARRAAEAWTGCEVKLEREPSARGSAGLGVALLEADDRTLAVWFHLARVVGDVAPPAPQDPTSDWTLAWLTPTQAALELTQVEERRLVVRVLAQRPRPFAALLGLGQRALPRGARGRWLALALAASAALGPLAAWRGWLAVAAWSPDQIPRLALAGFAGGLVSAALRLGPDVEGEPASRAADARPASHAPSALSAPRPENALLGALAGATVGGFIAAALASGVLANITLGPGAALAVAWCAAFLERALLRGPRGSVH